MAARFNILCRKLGYQAGTVEQQILRGYFIPRSSTTPGKARVWSLKDVYALAIFENLFSAGMPSAEACQLSYLTPFRQTQTLLFAAPRPGMEPGGIRGLPVGWIHHFAKDIAEFGPWTKAKNISTAITVLDLETAARRACAAFEAASQIEIPAGELPVAKPSKPKQLAAKRRPRGRS
jgi:hypothetical protein